MLEEKCYAVPAILEIERLRAENKILTDALQELVDLVENDDEASDPTTALYIAVHAAKVVLDPTYAGFPPRVGSPSESEGSEGEMSGAFSVRDYGAFGDGDVDDSRAIVDAVDAAKEHGGVVVFPPGTYRIRAVVAVPFGVSFRMAPNVHLTVGDT